MIFFDLPPTISYVDPPAIIRPAVNTSPLAYIDEDKIKKPLLQANMQQILLGMGGNSDYIVQSVQSGSIVLGTGVASNTATISAVTTANSVVIFNGHVNTGTSDNPDQDFAGVALTSSTVVTATRYNGGGSSATTVYFTVLEFKSGIIKTNQSGTIAIAATTTSNTATISAVTTTNSAVFFQGSTYTTSTAAPESVNARLNLTSSTVVTATRVGTPSTAVTTVYYTVLEFNSGILNSSTQELSPSLTTTSTSNTASLSAVTMGQTMLVWGGFTTTITTTSHANTFPCVVLTSTTQATISRVDTTTGTTTATVTVLEFKAASVKSINRAKTTMTASASQGTTISAVTTTKTAINYLGNTYSTTSTNQNYIWGGVYLNTATDVEVVRPGTSGDLSVSWEAIEFN